MKPLHDRVLVRKIDEENKTPGGIILTEVDKSKPVKGVVLSAGDKCEVVKSNDTIIFHIYSTLELTNGDEKCLMIRECDIIGIIN